MRKKLWLLALAGMMFLSASVFAGETPLNRFIHGIGWFIDLAAGFWFYTL